METWNINNYTLEYDDESHTYIVDGVIVPSVTQILGVKFGKKYAGVNSATLNRAASRGTEIHKAIEEYCTQGLSRNLREVHNFKFLMSYYNLIVLENETPIIISKDGTPIAAGRLDLVLSDGGRTALADIKTTASLDKEYLAYQLNLYRLGYQQSYGIEVEELWGVHLKEDKRKLVSIPIKEDIAWEIVEEYEKKGE